MPAKLGHKLSTELQDEIRGVLELNRGIWLSAEHICDILSWPVVERRIREYLDGLTRAGEVERKDEYVGGRVGRFAMWRWKEDADRD